MLVNVRVTELFQYKKQDLSLVSVGFSASLISFRSKLQFNILVFMFRLQELVSINSNYAGNQAIRNLDAGIVNNIN